MSGRGAWTTRGMPSNGTQYYQLVTPVNVGSQPSVDQDHLAVNYGVKAIQTRINELGFGAPEASGVPLPVDGKLGPVTSLGIYWAQKKLGVTADGQAGPATLKAMLWPVIRTIAGPLAHTVGGICAHESGFDPGAVGFQDNQDLGLVQINGPANPKLSIEQRFDYHIAYRYAADRIQAALNSGYPQDAAIASYGYPSVALYWTTYHTETFPPNPALNKLALDYVHYIKNWVAPN